ncbi:uncharacterized protein LOC34619091 [Cyclospora cayetanensis]|uniref:Uncharacterized protein LOC34619091 n=1 Tax=Cyclospora cayetanensis TaxID=88456 RepID=A0A6P6S1Z8_9EIME|nr:uncharacterized protein LOC34619091 [Cyclospora cayetanensis]
MLSRLACKQKVRSNSLAVKGPLFCVPTREAGGPLPPGWERRRGAPLRRAGLFQRSKRPKRLFACAGGYSGASRPDAFLNTAYTSLGIRASSPGEASSRKQLSPPVLLKSVSSAAVPAAARRVVAPPVASRHRMPSILTAAGRTARLPEAAVFSAASLSAWLAVKRRYVGGSRHCSPLDLSLQRAPAYSEQQRHGSLTTAAASASAHAAAASQVPPRVPPGQECHLATAATAARFALLRQLHDAAFWRELAAAAEVLLEALAMGCYTELSDSRSSTNNSGNCQRIARGLSACRSNEAARDILHALTRKAQQQRATGLEAAPSAAEGWNIDTRYIGLSLPVLINSFKQMRVYPSGLFAAAERAAHLHLHALSLHALSLLCCSFAAASAAAAGKEAAASPSVSFMLAVGNHCAEAAAETGPSATPGTFAASSSSLFVLPPKLLAAVAATAAAAATTTGLEGGRAQRAAPAAAAAAAAAYFHFVSWCHLLGAFARCGIPHQGLFEVAAPQLCAMLQEHQPHLLLLQQRQQQQMLLHQGTSSSSTHRHRQIVTPGALLTKAVQAFATFGYAHRRLLRCVSESLCFLSFSDEQLATLRDAMASLQHDDPLLDALANTRLRRARLVVLLLPLQCRLHPLYLLFQPALVIGLNCSLPLQLQHWQHQQYQHVDFAWFVRSKERPPQGTACERARRGNFCTIHKSVDKKAALPPHTSSPQVSLLKTLLTASAVPAAAVTLDGKMARAAWRAGQEPARRSAGRRPQMSRAKTCVRIAAVIEGPGAHLTCAACAIWRRCCSSSVCNAKRHYHTVIT